jgi:ribosomal-protein-alanine N-acetyltransferase
MTPLLRTERTRVRLATVRDAAKVLAYFEQSGNRYDPPLPDELLAVEHWERAAERTELAFAAGTDCRLFVFLPDESEIIGSVDLNAIKRELWHHCTLGFAISAHYEKTGAMFQAVRAVIDFAFQELNLHRIEARHSIDNVRSHRLLQRLGFESVGVIPQYRLSETTWQDYNLMSLLNPSWRR